MLVMARFLVFCLILVNVARLVSAMAADSEVIVMARKLGKHDFHSKIAEPSPSPSPSPSEALRVGGTGGAVMTDHRHRRRSIDKSVAGGGAILGVLATGFLVAVFCYIRATGRKHVQPGSPTDTSTGRKNVQSGSVAHP